MYCLSQLTKILAIISIYYWPTINSMKVQNKDLGYPKHKKEKKSRFKAKLCLVI